jgi:Xaa-Pro aminopeptidase
MSPLAPSTFVRRLSRVRANVLAASLDAFVVSHLPNVRYLTGFSGSAGMLVLLRSRCLLVVDFRYLTAAQELVRELPPDLIAMELADQSYDEALVGVLRHESSVRIGIEAAWLSVSRFNAISSALAAMAPFPLQSEHPVPALVPTERLVERVRIIKDVGEVETLREAARRLSAVARRLPSFVTAGRRECDIAFDLEVAMRDEGFSRPAFDTIVASGPNSAFPHARPTDRRLRAGDSTVLDFGGVYDGYCVDLTRTVQLGPAPEELRRLYQAVEEAHTGAVAAVRSGVRPSVIDAAAREVLQAHGLGAAFGHGTGHGIGLEVHEEPRVAREVPGLPDEPVEPGMVFTIEPGAYVPGLGGVRIEDDVLVTVQGCEVLTDAPRRIDIGA